MKITELAEAGKDSTVHLQIMFMLNGISVDWFMRNEHFTMVKLCPDN
jgi:hypothetical protein